MIRVVLPVSYESRYQHMVTGAAGGLTLGRAFTFGNDADPDRRWSLALGVSSVFTKYLYTSDLRGSFPGDTNGCRGYVPGGLASGTGVAGPAGSASDRCGGPVNTNFSFTTSTVAALSRGKWSFTAILLISNSFRYSFPTGPLTPINANDTGRTDLTWGILSLGYSFTERLGASVGLSSFQPALDSRYQNLRFPFFDFSGATANNYTQAFLSLTGTL